MERITGFTAGYQVSPARMGVEPMADAVAFHDSVTITRATTVKECAGPLVTSEKPAPLPPNESNIQEFFTPSGMCAVISRKQPSTEMPRGGWTLDSRTKNGSSTRFMRDHEATGRIVSLDLPETRPFGRLTREKDGWLGESIVTTKETGKAVTRSMMSTFFSDTGDISMSMMELRNDGTGTIHLLESGAYLENPRQAPPIKESFSFPLGERSPVPPFPYRTSVKTRELSTLGQFFGPGVPYAEVKRENTGSGQWRVHLPQARGGVNAELILRDSAAQGAENTVSTGESQPFGSWRRVPGGWESVSNGAITPENFGQVRSSTLRTTLDDGGSILMTLYEQYEDDTGCAYQLDVSSYLRNPRQAPPVLAQQVFDREHPLDETALRAKAFEKEFVPGPMGGESRGESLELEGDWLIIGGVRLEVNKEWK